MTDQVNACERAADPSCTESFTRRLAVAAYQADAAMEGAWFAHNYVETSGCEAEFISWCSPKAILRLLREHELFRQALLAHPSRGVVDDRSPSYDALLVIVQSVCAALDRAGVAECDSPGEAIDVMREQYEAKIAALQAAALPAVPEGMAEFDSIAVGVRQSLADGDGFWQPCSGCYETEDGQAVGHYPYSTTFQCTLGGGCSECGGLGAVWDNSDYAAMLAATPAHDQPEGKG